MSKTPEEAVRRLQDGDKNAFREIVEAYQATVRGLIAYMGPQPADVDDIAQNAFIHAYEHISEFEAGTNFEAWLKQIARFKTMAFLKKAKLEAEKRGSVLHAFLMGEVIREAQPDREDDDVMWRLTACMDRLDKKARALIEGRYAGVPLRKLASEIDRGVGAVKMQLLRIRLALKKCVEADG